MKKRLENTNTDKGKPYHLKLKKKLEICSYKISSSTAIVAIAEVNKKLTST